MRSIIAAAVLAVTPIAPALAAPPPVASTTKVDPAAVAAAGRLLDAIHFDQLLDRTMDVMIAQAEKTLPEKLQAATDEPIPDDLKAKVVGVIEDFMRRTSTANRAEIRKGTALIYAHHFTAAEIDHMAEMMRDPVMIKMQAELPGIMSEAVTLSQASVDRETPQMIEQLKSLIEDYAKTKASTTS